MTARRKGSAISSTCTNETETAEQSISNSTFEFVLMAPNGGFNKYGISQIRAHTTRELHKARRQAGQTFLRRHRNRLGNVYFGSQFDSFKALPQLRMEEKRPGILNEVKYNGIAVQELIVLAVFHVYNQTAMKQVIWPRGTKDDTFFTGMLLMCSVHLDSLHTRSNVLSPVSTALKLEAMRKVRERIQTRSADDIISSISAIACLAACALVRDEIEGADEYQLHRKAYAVLIKEAFEQRMFERSRFCKDVLRIITVIAIGRRCRMPTPGLAPVIDSAIALKEYEYVFEDEWQSRTHAQPELFSPVYDGREKPDEDAFPYVHTDHLRHLLQMMQSVIEIWTRQTRTPLEVGDKEVAVLDLLCPQILSLPSATLPGLACTGDYVYEACRVTSVLMIQSVERSQSWKKVAQGSKLMGELRAALERTELGPTLERGVSGGHWRKNLGLLYWIVLVFHCAAFGSADYAFAHALQTSLSFELTYNYHDWHGALVPMLMLKDVMPDLYD
ncbi:hypothetical protein PV08_02408 [Exophiala spinifera]|uniref:Transcription factor domain-containing protein n=1 Tax=Exophiala spinifera TaxID=91928 RepID=A0A0D2BHM8_9EURO|nr:uncharacterized protein PV08_02408 [Exophiala spinifera]KIW18120.1 hypothetical protein PV08_02408 [Exophiala spinifera]